MSDSAAVVDFAISYAGEDEVLASELAKRLRQLRFAVFLASEVKAYLAGIEGETFFERLFTEAKQVIVLLSHNYRRKDWPRFEWDVIRERENRFIPVRLDNTRMLGLPSNIFYVRFRGDNEDEIVDICVKKLLLYERDAGIRRPTEYERVLNAIREDSKGALAKAYQMVKDRRTRDPLEDVEIPSGYAARYQIVSTSWSNYSVIRRLCLKILVPPGLPRDELRFNLQHCAAEAFNAHKPDAVSVLAYVGVPSETDVNGAYTTGRVEFAPFGDWGKADEGVAYNIPTSEFDYAIDLRESYFRSS